MNNTRELLPCHVPDLIRSPAFIVWYIFIILCCVLPLTFECLNRRTILRILGCREYDYGGEEGHQFNFINFILGNNQASEESSSATGQQRRDESKKIWLKKQMQMSRMVVKETDFINCQINIDKNDTEIENSSREQNAKNTSKCFLGNSTSTVETTQTNESEESMTELGYGAKCESNSNCDEKTGIMLRTSDANGIQKRWREVPIECVICQNDYEVDDRIVWSTNEECPHVFHEHCIYFLVND